MARGRDERSFVGAFAEITTTPAPKSRSNAIASDPTRRQRSNSSASATTIHKTLSSSSSSPSSKTKTSPLPPPALQTCKIASLETGGDNSGDAEYKLAGHTCETIDEAEDDDGGRRPLLKENEVPRVVHFENAAMAGPPRSATAAAAPQEQQQCDKPRHRRRLSRLLCI